MVACGGNVGRCAVYRPICHLEVFLFDELSEAGSIFAPGRKTGAGTPAATVDGQVIGYRDAVNLHTHLN